MGCDRQHKRYIGDLFIILLNQSKTKQIQQKCNEYAMNIYAMIIKVYATMSTDGLIHE